VSILTDKMKKSATAVYLACEEEVARDISETLKAGASRIEELEAQVVRSVKH